ncbi:protein transport protein sft2 [Taxawa tesnikishii (nom. ined.)]|nr:protein transport protein sft2 [Dothideales sp. JES 119]
MASSSFRDSMNSLGWSRRDPAVPASRDSSSNPLLGKLQSLNPFGQGGVRLPLYENEAPGAPLPARTRREEEEGWFAREGGLRRRRYARRRGQTPFTQDIAHEWDWTTTVIKFWDLQPAARCVRLAYPATFVPAQTKKARTRMRVSAPLI